MSKLDVMKARSHFPSLNTGYIFAENAGGSQVIKEVVDRISDYLLNTNVQLGADYAVSVLSTKRVMVEGPTEAAKLFNAASPDEIVFRASSTMNLENLARGLEPGIQAGDEFILTGEHEANVGPWRKLATRCGAVLKYWNPTPTSPNNPFSVSLKIEDLLPLISSKTRIIAFTACSNILGSIVPVKDVSQAARATAKERGAVKVEIADIDFCVLSFYKVYGPHTSVLYVRSSALRTSITSITHHFLPVEGKPHKLQPGGPGYELVYGSTAVVPYLLSLTPFNTLAASFDAIAAHEQTLLEPLMSYLTAPAQVARGVRVVGEEKVDLSRVPTVSFVVVGDRPMKSKDVVHVFDQKGGPTPRMNVCRRWEYVTATSTRTLIDELSPKIDPDDGVVRISMVHYNTVQEVDRIIEILKEAFGA